MCFSSLFFYVTVCLVLGVQSDVEWVYIKKTLQNTILSISLRRFKWCLFRVGYHRGINKKMERKIKVCLWRSSKKFRYLFALRSICFFRTRIKESLFVKSGIGRKIIIWHLDCENLKLLSGSKTDFQCSNCYVLGNSLCNVFPSSKILTSH